VRRDSTAGVNRRALLAGVAAAGTVSTAGCLGVVGRTGPVTTRYVTGERPGERVRVAAFEVCSVADPAPGEARIHSDWREAFDLTHPVTVPRDLHRRLTDEFDDVAYHVGHRCEGCSTPRLLRGDFNQAHLGRRVTLFYRDHPWATLVGTGPERDGMSYVEGVASECRA
jgi:hypothetical protein